MTFRKTYGRALGKVLLMTYGTYQGLQYLWWNLDLDEVRREKQAEIERLEDEVARVSGVSGLPRLKLEGRKW
ncbi:hypothetical protein YB2330_004570 [Saitoella coloradoensis]